MKWIGLDSFLYYKKCGDVEILREEFVRGRRLVFWEKLRKFFFWNGRKDFEKVWREYCKFDSIRLLFVENVIFNSKLGRSILRTLFHLVEFRFFTREINIRKNDSIFDQQYLKYFSNLITLGLKVSSDELI